MTTSAVYDLIPNYDNTQHTQYPQGDKPEETLIQTPTQLQTSGETLTSIDLTWDMVEGYHTHFILQRWRLNTDTAWTEIAQPDELDRAYTDSADLLEGQHVGYRIAASDGTNQSDWSTEAWTYLLYTPTGDTDLSKITWTADWSAEDDGASMIDVGPAYGVQSAFFANVSSVRTLSGRKSARETVGDSSGNAIEGMGFEYLLSNIPQGEGSETWFRIWFYNEPGYVYDTDSEKRKTIRLAEVRADGSYGGGWCDFLTVGSDGYYSTPPNTLVFGRESADDDSSYKLDPSNTAPMVTGRWQCLEGYIKAGLTVDTGQVMLWVDGVHINTLNLQTLVYQDGKLWRYLYINYWNAGLPHEVTQSWCAPAIAVRNSNRDDTPYMDRDANGFPFIGLVT